MSSAETMVGRLLSATNQHDLAALVACFAEDYENETPVHPARSFRGREQVRRSWEQIFAFVPDLRAEVTRSAYDGACAWTEWELRGTRRDGTPHHMRGVVIFGVEEDLAGCQQKRRQRRGRQQLKDVVPGAQPPPEGEAEHPTTRPT